MRRTKIVATIGPASSQPETLRRLLEAGMNVARLNFSHGTHEEHRARCHALRQLAAEEGVPLGILQDLAGPKIRTGEFADHRPIELTPGAEVTITTRPVAGSAGLIPTSYASLAQDVQPGDHVLLHDGLIDLEVLSKTDADVRCRVLFGGRLGERQGINLPGVEISAPSFTEKDYSDLAFGLKLGVDLVALSFVRRAEDVQQVRKLIVQRGLHTPLIAKIERPQAVEQIDAILEAADGLMVARGDLGVEMPLERVPLVQKELIARANAAGKPVIVATQMLESMCTSARPTRAEVSDVASAILDGADAVMLSGETAAGQFPVQAVAAMSRIAAAAEERLSYYQIPRGEPSQPVAVSEAAADAACQAAEGLRAEAIAAFTHSGRTAHLVARRRPRAQLFAFTPEEHTRRSLSLTWGVQPFILPRSDNVEHMLNAGLDALRRHNLLAPGQTVVMVAGTALTPGSANLVRVANA